MAHRTPGDPRNFGAQRWDEGGGSGSGSGPIRPFPSVAKGQWKEAGLARRFRGSEEVKVDAKGRVSIPAKFRRVFEASDPDYAQGKRAQLVVVYGFADWTHLRLYTIEAIDEIDQGISRMPRGSSERSYLETLMNGLSEEAEIDADGRLVIYRLKADDQSWPTGHVAPRALVAVDCARSGTARVHTVGVRTREDLRRRWLTRNT